MDIRPPLITGGTLEEQVMQIIRYLIRLVKQLRELPENAPEQAIAEKLTPQGRTGFQKLMVGKDVVVGNNVYVAGSVNGVYMRTVELVGVKSFTIQCHFDNWQETGLHQTFLISGCTETGSVLGVLRVTDEKKIKWNGTVGTVTGTAKEWGSVLVELPEAVNDHFMIQSPEKFTILAVGE